ncbi:MAG: tetratricopeptide repeat protein [Alphaproteobacteria bacterium]
MILGKYRLTLLFLTPLILNACGHMPDMDTGWKAYKADNFDKAYAHYSELAEFGVPRAKIETGKILLYGKGSQDRDPERALQLFEQAKAEGEIRLGNLYIPRAKAKLGSKILKGEVQGYSDSEGLAMLKDAAATGDRTALFEMGYAYEKGLGVPVNGEKAAEYYAASGEKDYARGTFYQGQLYMKGDIVPQNIPKAVTLYEKAGEGGYPHAYKKLAQMYAEGKVVEANAQKAKVYKNMAAKS